MVLNQVRKPVGSSKHPKLLYTQAALLQWNYNIIIPHNIIGFPALTIKLISVHKNLVTETIYKNIAKYYVLSQ